MGPFTAKAPRTNGERYGIGEEGRLFGLLQALASMWSFSRCRFLEGDTSSLWYELGTWDANKKTLDSPTLVSRLNKNSYCNGG